MHEYNYQCTSLEWDTHYFGVKSAKVSLNNVIEKQAQDEILDYCNRYDFVTIKNSKNNDENNYWIGNRTNAFLVDTNIQFIKKLVERKTESNELTYVRNNHMPNEFIAKIAKNSFNYSRFFNDPNIPKELSENIYFQWTKNAFNEKDKYFVVYKKDGIIAGYILFSMDDSSAIIELIAVDNLFQGSGVGKSLVKTMENFVLKNGICEIKVGTQVENVMAIHFYTKMGFKYIECESVYHLWSK